jgi:hypothetical protein
MFPFRSGFIGIASMECSQEFWCVQVECRNPLVLITGMRPIKPLNVVTKRAMAVTPADLGIEDSRKFKMFIAVNDFDGTRWRLFVAGNSLENAVQALRCGKRGECTRGLSEARSGRKSQKSS